MKTIALWYESLQQETTNKKEIDIHINFWKLKSTWKASPYLVDLGFMIYQPELQTKLNIHFPFCFERKDIEDIGQIMIKNHKVVNAIFNENFSTQADAIHPKYLSVKNHTGADEFSIYAIDFDSDTEFTDCYEGTKLTIKLPTSKTETKKLYIRIRLKGHPIDYFIREHAPKNWFFQSAFTSTEVIDFRINEKRNFHNSLAEEAKHSMLCNINKVHFLLLRNSQDDLMTEHLNLNCRELEEDLWSEYVGTSYKVNSIVAYHWSEKASDTEGGAKKYIESFNTWVKVKYHKSNFKTIGLYLVVLAALSIGFNFVSSVIFNHFENSQKTSKQTNTISETTAKESSAKNIEAISSLNLSISNTPGIVFPSK